MTEVFSRVSRATWRAIEATWDWIAHSRATPYILLGLAVFFVCLAAIS